MEGEDGGGVVIDGGMNQVWGGGFSGLDVLSVQEEEREEGLQDRSGGLRRDLICSFFLLFLLAGLGRIT